MANFLAYPVSLTGFTQYRPCMITNTHTNLGSATVQRRFDAFESRQGAADFAMIGVAFSLHRLFAQSSMLQLEQFFLRMDDFFEMFAVGSGSASELRTEFGLPLLTTLGDLQGEERSLSIVNKKGVFNLSLDGGIRLSLHTR